MNGKIWKFRNYGLAESFRNRLTKTALILHGDDGRYWVAFGREAEELIRAGHEAVR